LLEEFSRVAPTGFVAQFGGHLVRIASLKEELTMGTGDKAQHKAEELKGKAKEKIGDATDNERMEGEGAAEAAEAKAKQAGDHVKDAGQDAKDALRR
jgi:uncharacterized protein YjbJ (UPF0337 family)